MERASTDNNLNEVISQTVKHFQLTNKKQEAKKMSEEILDKNTIFGILGNLYGVEAGLNVVSEKLGKDDNCGMEAIVAALTDKLSAQIRDLDTIFCRQLRSDS